MEKEEEGEDEARIKSSFFFFLLLDGDGVVEEEVGVAATPWRTGDSNVVAVGDLWWWA